MTFEVPEKFRVTTGTMGSDSRYGNNGLFLVKSLKLKTPLDVICSQDMGWEHVSVSSKTRMPSWDEMCFIKDLFWGEDDAVMQLHPPKSDYVNNHKYCLHLWRPMNIEIPLPPSIFVGVKEMGTLVE